MNKKKVVLISALVGIVAFGALVLINIDQYANALRGQLIPANEAMESQWNTLQKFRSEINASPFGRGNDFGAALFKEMGLVIGETDPLIAQARTVAIEVERKAKASLPWYYQADFAREIHVVRDNCNGLKQLKENLLTMELCAQIVKKAEEFRPTFVEKLTQLQKIHNTLVPPPGNAKVVQEMRDHYDKEKATVAPFITQVRDWVKSARAQIDARPGNTFYEEQKADIIDRVIGVETSAASLETLDSLVKQRLAHTAIQKN